MIPKGQCPVTGYDRQSVKCANCRYNRVYNPEMFLYTQETANKTNGTMCIATDADIPRRRRKTH